MHRVITLCIIVGLLAVGRAQTTLPSTQAYQLDGLPLHYQAGEKKILVVEERTVATMTVDNTSKSITATRRTEMSLVIARVKDGAKATLEVVRTVGASTADGKTFSQDTSDPNFPGKLPDLFGMKAVADIGPDKLVRQYEVSNPRFVPDAKIKEKFATLLGLPWFLMPPNDAKEKDQWSPPLWPLIPPREPTQPAEIRCTLAELKQTPKGPVAVVDFSGKTVTVLFDDMTLQVSGQARYSLKPLEFLGCSYTLVGRNRWGSSVSTTIEIKLVPVQTPSSEPSGK